MLKWLKKWWFKPKKPELHLVIEDDTSISIYSSWKPDSGLQTAQNFASMILLLQDGHLNDTILQSVGIFGHEYKTTNISNTIIDLVANNINRQTDHISNNLCIHPLQTFAQDME